MKIKFYKPLFEASETSIIIRSSSYEDYVDTMMKLGFSKTEVADKKRYKAIKKKNKYRESVDPDVDALDGDTIAIIWFRINRGMDKVELLSKGLHIPEETIIKIKNMSAEEAKALAMSKGVSPQYRATIGE